MAPDINPTMIIINVGTAIFVAVLAFVLNGMREGHKLAVLESKAHDEFSAGARGRRETDDRKQE